jgi:hypothetical protein
LLIHTSSAIIAPSGPDCHDAAHSLPLLAEGQALLVAEETFDNMNQLGFETHGSPGPEDFRTAMAASE